jgi:hypothetical protein
MHAAFTSAGYPTAGATFTRMQICAAEQAQPYMDQCAHTCLHASTHCIHANTHERRPANKHLHVHARVQRTTKPSNACAHAFARTHGNATQHVMHTRFTCRCVANAGKCTALGARRRVTICVSRTPCSAIAAPPGTTNHELANTSSK